MIFVSVHYLSNRQWKKEEGCASSCRQGTSWTWTRTWSWSCCWLWFGRGFWPGFPLGVKIKSAPKCQALLKFPTQFPLSTPWQLSDTHTDTLASHMHIHSYTLIYSYTLMGTCQFDLLFPLLLFLFCSFYALFCLQETEIVRLNRQFAFPVPLMSWIHPPSVRTIAQIRTWVPLPGLLMLSLFHHGWNRITIIIIFNISMASQILCHSNEASPKDMHNQWMTKRTSESLNEWVNRGWIIN